MIVYKDILRKLSDAGYSSYVIQKNKIIPNSTLERIRKGSPINTVTLDTLCKLCKCQPGDLLAWVPDDTGGD